MGEWKRNKKRTNGIPRGLCYGMMIEARQRDGTIFTGVVGTHKWLQGRHFNTSHDCNSDVMAYRILEQNEPATPDYTNGYPEGTTSADIGAKVGDEFVVVTEKYGHCFDIGDVVTLDKIKENGTYQFSKDDASCHLLFDELAPVPQKPAIELQAEEVVIPDLVHVSDDEGWIEWHGGECPVAEGTLVDVIFRDGTEASSTPANVIDNRYFADASHAFWYSHGRRNDIVAYRLSKPDWPEDRIDVIGQNGNTGEHYAIDTSPERVENEAENVHVDMVNKPPHYKQGDVECIDAIKAALTPDEWRGYCKGNALKYIWRERHKGGDESLQKAIWYLNRLVK